MVYATPYTSFFIEQPITFNIYKDIEAMEEFYHYLGYTDRDKYKHIPIVKEMGEVHYGSQWQKKRQYLRAQNS